MTLRHLIDANLIAPGVDVVSTLYNGVTELATLRDDGAIAWDGREFHSVSAFSLAVKRRTNPDRKADDGWKCVKCDGVALDAVKRRTRRPSRRGVPRVPRTAAGDGAIVKARRRRGAGDAEGRGTRRTRRRGRGRRRSRRRRRRNPSRRRFRNPSLEGFETAAGP